MVNSRPTHEFMFEFQVGIACLVTYLQVVFPKDHNHITNQRKYVQIKTSNYCTFDICALFILQAQSTK